jgi:pimeloyl-ACP methyl ester carboxylesterase
MNDLKAAARLRRCRLADIELCYQEAGPKTGPLVILLHGFPEYRGAWAGLAPVLAAAGFRVVLPDQRGYGFSSKPGGIAAYDLDLLAADVVGLAKHLGHERFDLVGHDWGASVGWWLATRQPQALRRLAVINAPHPAIWREAMSANLRQWFKSLYVRIMRLPGLPERMVAARDFGALRDALAPAGLSPAALAGYREAWGQPGALTGMINWYRAFLAKRLPPSKALSVTVPTLVIWGDRDPYAVPQLAEASAKICTDVQITHLPEATHWTHHEQPDRVGALLIDFLGSAQG